METRTKTSKKSGIFANFLENGAFLSILGRGPGGRAWEIDQIDGFQ